MPAETDAISAALIIERETLQMRCIDCDFPLVDFDWAQDDHVLLSLGALIDTAADHLATCPSTNREGEYSRSR